MWGSVGQSVKRMGDLQQLLASAGSGAPTFLGKFTHNLDPKKRLTIPSGWRDLLGEDKTLYVLPGMGRPCLMLMPRAAMTQMIQRIEQLSVSDPSAMDQVLALASESESVNLDAQGRIRVKDDLMERAGLDGEIILAGAWSKIELWNASRFDEWKKDAPALGDAAKALGI